MKFIKLISATTLMLLCACCTEQKNDVQSQRKEFTLEKNWKFSKGDFPTATASDFDDSSWQTVTVPHDWAIYGPFSIQNDKQDVAISQDGQTAAMEHAGRTGGLPFVGVGWYRTNFELADFSEDKHAEIVFDGAMSRAEVYVNGEKAGFWPYGYNSFHLDITKFAKPGKNTLAVRLENLTESSRWYPGAGLYRNVHLIVTNKTHIPVWGTQVTTPVASRKSATIKIKTNVVSGENCTLKSSLISPKGKEIKTVENKISAETTEQEMSISKPLLWDVESPNLYKIESRVYKNGNLIDLYTTTFGIRSIEVVPDKGFFLNGEKVVFKGVCEHHDLGALGAAVNDAAIRYKIRMLKNMGCNAIRTSHNMPAPELIKACDEMGMMVMAESFDEWNIAKCKNGYHLLFDEWAEKDMMNELHQFRNSASIVMWCIGNEVPNQGSVDGYKVAEFLQNICHREDPTRPVTQGMDAPDAVVNNGMAAVMDIAGFNYRPFKYKTNYEKIPQKLILGSETASTVSSRGVYKFPVERKAMQKYDDHQSSSYDVEHCGWSDLPEDNFIQHEDLPYCIGEFVWTGFDYLGEPTPYYTDWPSHSSLFGIIDLAGIPKDRYYLYRSHWNKKENTLHVLPHWTWPGREGEITPIFVYTNYPTAEVFINGKSQGKRTKDLSITLDSSHTAQAQKSFERQKRYRLMWMDTKYEPGAVKVVAYDDKGNVVAETEMHTAGAPHHIELSADRKQILANSKDLSYVNVRIVDKDGNLCPNDGRLVKFAVEGAGTYRAGANGDATCVDLFHLPQMHAFSGQLTAIVQSGENAGTAKLTASADGIESSSINIEVK